MQKKILFMDNTARALNAHARLLEAQGYTVLRATSVREAEEKLLEQHIHLAIFDIRMEAEDSAHDISGLELVEKDAYRHVPKIIFTAYPSWPYAEMALGVALEGKLVGLVDKGNGPEALTEAVEKGFSEYVPVNWGLVIRANGSRQLSIPQIAALIMGENGRFSPRHVDELEDILRRLFFGYRQITLQKLFGLHQDKVYLNVVAHADSGISKHYLVVCGKRLAVEEELDKHEHLVPANPQGNQLAFETQEATTCFAAATYLLDGGRTLDDLQTLADYYQFHHAEQLQMALQAFFAQTLAPWHRQARIQKAYQETADFLLKKNRLDRGKTFLAELEDKLDKICANLLGLGIDRIDLTYNKLDIYLKDKLISLPNPMRGMKNEWLPSAEITLWGTTHSNLSAHALLLSPQMDSWLLDYEAVKIAPLITDFVDLELATYFQLWHEPEIAARFEQTERLVAAIDKPTDRFLVGARCTSHKMLGMIQVIRKAKTAVLPTDAQVYAAALFYGAMGKLANYDSTIYHAPTELLPYLQALLLVAYLNQQWQKTEGKNELPFAAENGLWIDLEREEVWVKGEPIALSIGEFRLLRYLYEQKGGICDNIQIAENVFDVEFPSNITEREKLEYEKSRIQTAISRLRKKIEPNLHEPQYILSKRGRGYYFREK